MKKIEAIIRPSKVAVVNEALTELGSPTKARDFDIVSNRHRRREVITESLAKRFSDGNLVFLQKLPTHLNVRLVEGPVAKLMRSINNVTASY